MRLNEGMGGRGSQLQRRRDENNMREARVPFIWEVCASIGNIPHLG